MAWRGLASATPRSARRPRVPVLPAESRADPYFVDIPNTNGAPGTQRIWFSHP